MLERLFGLSKHQTNVSKEMLAGLTTFLTMAYIIFVNPFILSQDFTGQPTGLDFGAVLLATCLVSALTTFFMGLYANYPIALAPGMGENFFFVTVIVTLSGMGIPEAWKVTRTANRLPLAPTGASSPSLRPRPISCRAIRTALSTFSSTTGGPARSSG